jgi:hypothetical protein
MSSQRFVTPGVISCYDESMKYLLAFALIGTAAANAATIQVHRLPGRELRLRVETDGPVQQRVRSVQHRLVIDIFPAHLRDQSVSQRAGFEVFMLDRSTVRICAPGAESVAARDPRGFTLTILPRRVRHHPHGSNYHWSDTELTSIVKTLAGRRILYLGPGVAGRVSAQVIDTPAEGALMMVLRMQDSDYLYKLIGTDKLVVGVSECRGWGPVTTMPPGAVRQEYLINGPPAAMIASLKEKYPAVLFTPHPTMNGFYAIGQRPEHAAIRSSLVQLEASLSLDSRHSDSK